MVCCAGGASGGDQPRVDTFVHGGRKVSDVIMADITPRGEPRHPAFINMAAIITYDQRYKLTIHLKNMHCTSQISY